MWVSLPVRPGTKSSRRSKLSETERRELIAHTIGFLLLYLEHSYLISPSGSPPSLPRECGWTAAILASFALFSFELLLYGPDLSTAEITRKNLETR